MLGDLRYSDVVHLNRLNNSQKLNQDFLNRSHPVVYFIFSKMVSFRLNTTTIHQFLGYMFRFLENRLQANVNQK